MNVTTPAGDYFQPLPVPSDSARITALETRLADAERRIAELEKDSAARDPWKQWPWIDQNPIIDPVVEPNACSVCGMRFEGPMGYVCHNPRCPSGVTYCAKTPYETTTAASDCGSVGTS